MSIPNPTREQVYTKMFSLVSTLKVLPMEPAPTVAHPFVTVTRDITEPQRIPPASQPILMQYEFSEDYRYSGKGLVQKVWTVVYIIGLTHKNGTSGATLLNPIIDQVEALFAPADETGQMDLGFQGLQVQLVGPGGKDHGDNSTRENKQAIYYLPVQIILPLTVR